MISVNLLCLSLAFEAAAALSMTGQCPGKTTGVLSQGYINLPNCIFSQTGSAQMVTEEMSVIEAEPGASIQMADGADISTGTYSRISLGKYCDLQMASHSVLQAEANYDDGRIEVICNDSWTFGERAVLHMEQQTLINVTGRFELRAGVQFRVLRHSLLTVGSAFILEDDINLTLSPHSSFTVSPNNPAVSTISSSNQNTMTTVFLGYQAEVFIDGSFIVGHGTQTRMSLYDNGALLIKKQGSFRVEASSFFIGPSSFWVISGSFFVDGSGFLFSGLQSNLSIAGNFEGTKGATIHIEDGTTLSVEANGQVASNGAITMESSSQMIIQGKLTMGQGTALTMGSFSGFRIGGGVSLIMNGGSSLTIGARSSIAIDGTALCLFSNQGNITNNIQVICTPGLEQNCPQGMKCYGI